MSGYREQRKGVWLSSLRVGIGSGESGEVSSVCGARSVSSLSHPIHYSSSGALAMKASIWGLLLFLTSTFFAFSLVLSQPAAPGHGALRCLSCFETFATPRGYKDHRRALHTRELPGRPQNIRIINHPSLNGASYSIYKICDSHSSLLSTSSRTGLGFPSRRHTCPSPR
jgi:hypothetical protein